MKQFILFFTFVLFSTTSFAQAKTTDIPNNKFAKFEELTHNFGEITDQEDAFHTFKFVNTSGKTIVLNPPKTSCGCTASSYPKEPIKPFESDSIEVKYSTKGRIGKFSKTISVYAQGYAEPIVLRITGEVKSPKEISTLPKKQKNSLFK